MNVCACSVLQPLPLCHTNSILEPFRREFRALAPINLRFIVIVKVGQELL